MVSLRRKAKEPQHGKEVDPQKGTGQQGKFSRKNVAPPKKIQLKKGDYQIQVFVHEARELRGRDAGGTSDPLVEVEVMDVKQITEKREKTSSAVWNQLLMFEFPDADPQELEFGKVMLSVMDANALTRNVMIGGYELDVMYIYRQPNHELYKQWVALTDVTDENEGIQGYLKVSIVVLGPGDEQVSHDPDEQTAEEADADLSSLVLMPPKVKQEGHLLYLNVHKAEGLPKVDSWSGCDPFVRVQYAGNPPQDTDVKDSTLDPVWNETLKLPVMTPVMTDRVEIQVWDYNKVTANVLVGTTFIRFSEVEESFNFRKLSRKEANKKRKAEGRDPLPEKSKREETITSIRNRFDSDSEDDDDADREYSPPDDLEPIWVNLYGAPVEGDNEVAEKMNKGRMEGIVHRGRLLLSVWQHAEKEPKLMKSKLKEKLKEPAQENFTVRVELYEGAELASKKNTRIEVAMGQHVVTSKNVHAQEGVAKWYESLPELKGNFTKESLPDIFLYLVRDGERIGYIRHKPEDIWGPADGQADWSLILEDKALDALPDGEIPGYLLYDISFDFTDQAKKERRIAPAQPKMKQYTLFCHIYQGKDLPAADEEGTLDPYLVIRVGGAKLKIDTKSRTTCPVWYETYKLECELPEQSKLDLAADITVLCYDYDKFSSDDLIGRFTVQTDKLGAAFPGDPKWHKLYLEDPTDTEGQILASFQLIPSEKAHNVRKMNLRPESEAAIAEITVLGVRDLEPVGRFDINCPYVEFDLGDRGKTAPIWKTNMSNKPSGSNANYLEVVQLPFNMPKNPLYCPSVNLRVFDSGKIKTSLVATAAIDLEPYQKEMYRQVRELRSEGHDDGEFDFQWDDEAVVGAGKDGEEEVPFGQRRRSRASTAASAQSKNEEEEEGRGRKNKKSKKSKSGSDSDRSRSRSRSKKGKKDEVYIDIESDEEGKSKKKKGDKKKEDDKSKKEKEKGEEKKDEVIDPDDDPKKKKKRKDDFDDTPEYMKGRLTLDNEIEDFFEDKAFHEIDLYRGQKRGLSAIEKLSESAHYHKCGKFKGYIRIIRPNTVNPPSRFNLDELMNPKPYVARVYVLSAANLVPKDSNGSSDPYPFIKIGDKTITDDNSKKDSQLNPEFYKMYQVDCLLPGTSTLEVGLMDYDMIGSDELIGSTKIDLENLFFDPEWHARKPKIPVETRTLWNPASSTSQGKMKMWVDIMTPGEAKARPPIDITPPPPMEFELRCVVWKTRDVVAADTISNQNDMYITVAITGQDGKVQSQNTDIHWRCKKGKGSFNYRTKFNVTLPDRDPRLKVQAWDQDLLMANDAIGEATISLKRLYRRAFFLKKPCELHNLEEKLDQEGMEDKDGKYKVWIPIRNPNKPEDGVQGEIQITVELLPIVMAQKLANGEGQGAPNLYPLLLPPDRIKFNLFRPDLMIAECLGPELCAKFRGVIICCCCCVFLMVTIFVMGWVANYKNAFDNF